MKELIKTKYKQKRLKSNNKFHPNFSFPGHKAFQYELDINEWNLSRDVGMQKSRYRIRIVDIVLYISIAVHEILALKFIITG